MITKAYISDIYSTSRVRVRIPLFNKIEGVNGSTPKDELSVACICTLPNCKIAPQVGDVVLVGFEEDNTSKPVVLGFLSRESDIGSITDIKCDKLEAIGDVILDEHTTIGKVTPENIKCLMGLELNVAEKFGLLDKDIKDINKATTNLESNFIGSVKDTTKQFEIVNNNVSQNTLNITTLDKRLSNAEKSISNKIKVGTNKPTLSDFDEDTQVYLWIQL